jgi:serine/threonine protein kinase
MESPLTGGSLDVLIFEFLTGYPPFHSVNESELFQQILGASVEFPLGGCVSEEAKDFVYRLLERDPAKRLGFRGGVAEVRAHPLFDDVNWNVLYRKQLQLPFAPEIEEALSEKTIAAAFAINIPLKKTESTNLNIPLF